MSGERSKMIARHIAALKTFDGKKVEAGWFETNRYPANDRRQGGVPVAQVARLLEFGGTIQHPGGTPYIEDAIVGGVPAGARFVHQSDFEGQTLKKTKPHVINIPARPFMRWAASQFMSVRRPIQKKITNNVMNGKITAEQALGQIGMALEGEIVKSIRNGNWAPNAPSTIARKGFDKPLIESSLMWQSVSSKVS
jgi:hypothetical protein